MKKFPHVYVTLFIMIIVSAILTYTIPASQYDYQLQPASMTISLMRPANLPG